MCGVLSVLLSICIELFETCYARFFFLLLLLPYINNDPVHLLSRSEYIYRRNRILAYIHVFLFVFVDCLIDNGKFKLFSLHQWAEMENMRARIKLFL